MLFPQDLEVFIVGFSHSTSLYYHNPQDPFTSIIKKKNYESGSLLQDKDHPLIHNPY